MSNESVLSIDILNSIYLTVRSIRFSVKFGANENCATVLLELFDSLANTREQNANSLFTFGPEFCNATSPRLLFSMRLHRKMMSWKHSRKMLKVIDIFRDEKWHLFTVFVDRNKYYVSMDQR